ncbi:MAG: arginine--tRNA ligase [Bacteroidales bacterium]|nr:arginine--tRNA ligase [Bacteroidales bacterium]
MNFEKIIQQSLVNIVKELYHQDIDPTCLQVNKTRKDQEGDFTVVVFPLSKMVKASPEAIAGQLGDMLVKKLEILEKYNVVKGFLNLFLTNEVWLQYFKNIQNTDFRFFSQDTAQPVVVEFSSPNTNKPLHLGHVRNNLLGCSVCNILEANGHKVVRVNLVNDRGIHICKSMVAWLHSGNGETPKSSGMKGDHLVGKYYVEFDRLYKAEIAGLTAQGMDKETAEKQAPILQEAQEMLRKWENGDPEVRSLWKQMNAWVYEGFDATYQRLGIAFNKIYYESDTYLLGKKMVEKGLQLGTFYHREDGAVCVDLKEEGLDEKVLLRSDGTSVYMTQDLGTAALRYEEYHPQKMIYIVGNEQNYHFDVLKLVLDKKLHLDWGKSIYHLSYGMVELPSGKMKSREGTVVDADDLMQSMVDIAEENTRQLGKTDDFSDAEIAELSNMVGLGALKYFILKVDPKKNMMFNPEESIDMNGNTAPFIQYTHARISSLLRKAEASDIQVQASVPEIDIPDGEKQILRALYDYAGTLEQAGIEYSPALIANYAYNLVKLYNQFYQATPILREENSLLKLFRIQLSRVVARYIAHAMSLLGIAVPEKM